MVDWEILNGDGKYLGRSETISAATAFCRCMLVMGTKIEESEVESSQIEDGLYRITYSGKHFFANEARRPRPKIRN